MSGGSAGAGERRELALHEYQRACVNFIKGTPNCALWLDMGLGKTVITLVALWELKRESWAVGRVLVVAPKKVAETVWQNEARKWDRLAGLRVSTVLGTAAQRRDALRQEADVYVVNRDAVAWLVREVGARWPFDAVVLDESSSFKNHRAKRFKALKSVRPRIGRLIELTGTPSPNGLEDLWAQIYLLDGGKRLGRTISVYRDLYFEPDKRNAYQVWSYRPRPGADAVIYNALSDICMSMRAADYLELPDFIQEVIPVRLDEATRREYETLEREALLEVTEDEWVSAGTAAVLTGKLLQLCNGAVYDEAHGVHEIHRAKLEALLETLEQINGHALVYYQFQHDRDRILRALEGSGARVRVYRDARDADAWNAGAVDVLLAHPASAGYGLNLQAGGHHIVWFGLTWALEQFQQANARLYRQGQDMPVICHILAVEASVDEDVIESLTGKENAQNALLRALKAKRDVILKTGRAES